MTPQWSRSLSRWLSQLRKPCPRRRVFSMIRLTASVASVGSAGTVIVEGLFFPGPQRPRQAIDLGHVNCLCPAVDASSRRRAVSRSSAV